MPWMHGCGFTVVLLPFVVFICISTESSNVHSITFSLLLSSIFPENSY